VLEVARTTKSYCKHQKLPCKGEVAWEVVFNEIVAFLVLDMCSKPIFCSKSCSEKQKLLEVARTTKSYCKHQKLPHKEEVAWELGGVPYEMERGACRTYKGLKKQFWYLLGWSIAGALNSKKMTGDNGSYKNCYLIGENKISHQDHKTLNRVLFEIFDERSPVLLTWEPCLLGSNYKIPIMALYN